MIRSILLSLLLLLGGCAQVPYNLSLTDRAAVGSYQYKIGPGDKLKVTTYGEERLSGEFVVGSEGLLAFPLVGDVSASGKTVGEFKDELRTRLGGQFLRNPQISVEMINFRPVYILGEVAKPGEFPYAERMSVFALVAKAGGFTYRANQVYAFIRRENEPGEQAVRLTSGTAVEPGDTIRIPERMF